MSTSTSPKFASEINDLYSAGIAHAFVISGNVADYVAPGVAFESFIKAWFSSRTVVFYNRSAGFSFPTPSMEKAFRQMLSDGQPQPATPTNPALAALAQSRGQSLPTGQDDGPLPTSPEAALPLIEKAMRQAERQSMAVIVEFAETVCPNGDIATMSPADRTTLVTLSRWGRDPELEKKGHFIFLVTESAGALNDAIKAAGNKYAQIQIEYPSTSERLEYIEWWIVNAREKAAEEGQQALTLTLTTREMANLTAGLNRTHIEDIFLRGQLEGQLTPEMIKDRKRAIIASEFGDVLEVLEPKGGFELVGGLDYIKEYFVKSVINPMRQGEAARVPMGVLMLGPAGTGKSIMAASVAYEARINAVKLNLGGQIASKWQGEGERKLAKALDGISNFAPTLVFIDEIDQVTGRGSGDNQQDSRIFQMLMEYMSDTNHRGQVVFLAASNRPDLIDPAMRRAGRFDDKIAFLVPTSEERAAIFQVFAKKYSLPLDEVPSQAVELTEGYTGAELEGIARKAYTVYTDQAVEPEDALVIACRKIKPTTQSIQFMTNLALAEISDADLIPPAYQGLWQDSDALQAQISEQAEQVDRRQARR